MPALAMAQADRPEYNVQALLATVQYPLAEMPSYLKIHIRSNSYLHQATTLLAIARRAILTKLSSLCPRAPLSRLSTSS